MLRAGKTIREAADELMDAKWMVNELTEYNYSRLDYRGEDDDRMPLDDRRNLSSYLEGAKK